MPNITARDFASILNMNPYETPYQCLQSNIIKKSFFGNKFTEHGCKYEKSAIEMYEKETNNKVNTEQVNCSHPEYEWITGRVDGTTIINKKYSGNKKRKIECVIEVKCPIKKQVEQLSIDNIPIYYWAQCQVYMNMLNYDITHYVEFYIEPNAEIETGKLMYIEIKRDIEWWDKVLPKIKLFYDEMVKYSTLESLENHPIRIKEKEWEKKFIL